MSDFLITGGTLINEGTRTQDDLLIRNGRIHSIGPNLSAPPNVKVIDASGMLILPGLIDDQVHFREPGLTHKACIHTESKAAVAGGVTTFFEMPNVSPPTLSMDRIEEKCAIAKQDSLANHAFFVGASNENLENVFLFYFSLPSKMDVFLLLKLTLQILLVLLLKTPLNFEYRYMF